MANNVLYTTDAGEKFWCSKEQSDTLDVLKELNAGGIGTIYGYRPTSGYSVSPVMDVQVITRISVEALYKRKIAALESVSYSDVKEFIEKSNDSKLSSLDAKVAEDLFNDRKNRLIASMKKTLEGDRSDAARQGHDRNNITVCKGVKVNLEGRTVDGIKHPNLFDGYPIAATINLMCIEIGRTVRQEGVYKTVNSGAPVLVENLIEKQLNSKSIGLKTFSLDSSKFEKIVVAKKSITRDDIKDAVRMAPVKFDSIVEEILYLIEAYNA